MSSPKPSRTEQKKFWTPARLVLTIAVFSIVAAFGLSSCNSSNQTANPTANANNITVTKSNAPANPNAPAPAQPAAPAGPLDVPATVLNAELKDINGGSLKLSDYNGKVVIVNMWATWCGPCRIETPELVAMSKEFKGRGVEIIGLTTQQNDPDIDAVKNFVRDQKVGYRTVYDDGSLASSLTKLTRARSVIPQSFVISREGQIIKHFEGFNPNSTPQLLRLAVEQAINYKS
ncbi:MAG: TlpA family protein disulfide reductase [Acidobacteria bacterium]|nr:TlpA family protein disulfide reductase [Acidobacteriota bacterium]